MDNFREGQRVLYTSPVVPELGEQPGWIVETRESHGTPVHRVLLDDLSVAPYAVNDELKPTDAPPSGFRLVKRAEAERGRGLRCAIVGPDGQQIGSEFVGTTGLEQAARLIGALDLGYRLGRAG